jgi:hypothetical protein
MNKEQMIQSRIEEAVYAALKEQMERVMYKLPEVARRQISQKHSLWFDDVDSTEIDELVDAIVEALKAELEGENG